MQQRSTKLSLSRVLESRSQKRTWKLQKCDLVLNLGSLEIASRSTDAQNLFKLDSTNWILPLSLNYFRKKKLIHFIFIASELTEGNRKFSFLEKKSQQMEIDETKNLFSIEIH